MQVQSANDVKIYNLSAGKSIPEWISDRKRRRLERKHIDLRRRIQLIQDFDMPDISNTVTVSPDGRYIFATGTYKPFLKCFDVNNLSLKFSRGLDADVVKMVVLSDDYSKFILLEDERYLEMHAAYGRYFRMRIPKFGRDMAFCREVSDLYIVGSGSEIFRLNLEEGKFLEPLTTSSPSLTCCEFNGEHQLFVCGTSIGHIEAWDHRDASRCGILDCASHLETECQNNELPQVSAVRFKDALHLGVGTSTGHILLYDIRSRKPLLVKDHQTGLPITKLDFVPEHRLVLSMDMRVMKIWEEWNGKPFAAIEPGTSLNDFCRYPDSGLLFFANEDPKMLQYFVPAIGTAPKWCSYLEAITEELEETEQPAVYDDYKFVTAEQLEEIGLSHLIGTSLLRAYMHGYFMDIRLYNKAKTFMQPFAFENYKKGKIREKLDKERSLPTVLKQSKKKLPTVNKELAAKLMAEMSLMEKEKIDKKTKKHAEEANSILSDERFGSLFTNPDFQVDENSEQYQLLAPAIKKLEEKRRKLKRDDGDSSEVDEELKVQSSMFMEDPDMDANASSSSGSSDEEEDEDTSESDEEVNEVVNNSGRMTQKGNDPEESGDGEEIHQETSERRRIKKPVDFELIELDTGEDAAQYMKETAADDKVEITETLGSKREQFAEDAVSSGQGTSFGGRQMTFKLKARGSAAMKERLAQKQKQHLEERKELRRGTREITKTLKRPPGRGRGRGSRRGFRR